MFKIESSERGKDQAFRPSDQEPTTESAWGRSLDHAKEGGWKVYSWCGKGTGEKKTHKQKQEGVQTTPGVLFQ